MKIFTTENVSGHIYKTLLLLCLVMPVMTGYGQTDPDIPDFAKYKTDKEEFMKRRAEAIGMKRGFDTARPVDPGLRIMAIRQMEDHRRMILAGQAPYESNLISEAWMPIGPAPIPNGQTQFPPTTAVSGRVTAIAVHPANANIAYVGTAQGGLYRTTDGGTNWTPLMDNALSLAIGSVAISPSQPETIYIGTGEPNFSADSYFGVGVYRIDNASTTANLSGPFNQTQQRLIYLPGDQ